jgi:hypothetical protein
MLFEETINLYQDQVEAAVDQLFEKRETTFLIPLNQRKQLNELSDEMVTKINIQYYTDLRDCLVKTLME